MLNVLQSIRQTKEITFAYALQRIQLNNELRMKNAISQTKTSFQIVS